MSKQSEKEQLTQATMEVQREFIQNSQKVKMYDQQLMMAKRNKEKFGITVKEISKLEKDHKTYQSIGRAFFLTPKDQVAKEYTQLAEQSEKDFLEAGKTKSHFEGKHKELEKQLTEMVTQLKAMQ